MRRLLFAFALSMISWQVAHAESDIQKAVDPAYPGYGAETGSFTPYVQLILQESSMLFYMLHGRWPRTFAEVRKEGLVQVDLVGYRLDVINPDDGQLNFAGDVTFSYKADKDMISIRWLDLKGRPRFTDMTEKPTRIIQQMLDRGEPEYLQPEQKGHFAAQKSDFNLHREYCLASMIRKGMSTFELLHGRSPHSWDELAASKLAGLDKNSINPRNGKKIDGLGGPNGIVVRNIDGIYEVAVRDAEGKPLKSSLHF